MPGRTIPTPMPPPSTAPPPLAPTLGSERYGDIIITDLDT